MFAAIGNAIFIRKRKIIILTIPKYVLALNDRYNKPKKPLPLAYNMKVSKTKIANDS